MFPCFWISFIPIGCTFIIIWFFKAAYKTFFVVMSIELRPLYLLNSTPLSYPPQLWVLCFLLFLYLSNFTYMFFFMFQLFISWPFILFMRVSPFNFENLFNLHSSLLFPFFTLFLYFVQLLFLILAQVTSISGPAPHYLFHFAFYAVSLIVGFSQLFLYLAYSST